MFLPADPEPVKREAESGVLALIQPSIRAIGLIGPRLLGRDDQTVAIRKFRDDVLATVPAGREWIALFERVQAPLVQAVLSDEKVAREAADLVTLAGELLSNHDKTIDRTTVSRADELLPALDRSVPELAKVRAQPSKVTGRCVAEAIDTVLAEAPA